MNQKTIIIVCALLLGVVLLSIPKVLSWQDHQRQMSLAREMRKAISATMLDLSQARTSSIMGIPTDGNWYHDVSFDTHGYGVISYALIDSQLIRKDARNVQVIANHVQAFNVRRTPKDPAVIDVKVVLKQGIVLPSNFRVRLQE